MEKLLTKLRATAKDNEAIQKKNEKYKIKTTGGKKFAQGEWIADLEELRAGAAKAWDSEEVKDLDQFHNHQRGLFTKAHKSYVPTRYCEFHYGLLKEMAGFVYYLKKEARKFDPAKFVTFLKKFRNEEKVLFFMADSLMKFYHDQPNAIQSKNITDSLMIIKYFLKAIQLRQKALTGIIY